MIFNLIYCVVTPCAKVSVLEEFITVKLVPSTAGAVESGTISKSTEPLLPDKEDSSTGISRESPVSLTETEELLSATKASLSLNVGRSLDSQDETVITATASMPEIKFFNIFIIIIRFEL